MIHLTVFMLTIILLFTAVVPSMLKWTNKMPPIHSKVIILIRTRNCHCKGLSACVHARVCILWIFQVPVQIEKSRLLKKSNARGGKDGIVLHICQLFLPAEHPGLNGICNFLKSKVFLTDLLLTHPRWCTDCAATLAGVEIFNRCPWINVSLLHSRCLEANSREGTK